MGDNGKSVVVGADGSGEAARAGPPIAPTRPIIVGVDGSKDAIRAAIWAIDEALERDTGLRLVYVIDADDGDLVEKYRQARLAIHEARVAVEATGQPVRVGYEVIQGDPAETLVEESRSTPMVCVGAQGMHDSAPNYRGNTGTTVAEAAFGPVAIIRRRHTPSDRWVVAAIDESPVSRDVLRTALDEARRRKAPLLVLTSWPTDTHGLHYTGDDLRVELDRLLQESRANKAHTRVTAESLTPNLADLLAQTADIDQLVIVGKNNLDLITELIGPEARAILSQTNCSVMVFRDQPAR